MRTLGPIARPPKCASDRVKTIIFDLDETLIHCDDESNLPCDHEIEIQVPEGEQLKVILVIKLDQN